MSRRISIPLNDIPGSPCVFFYTVETRFTGDPNYTLYPEQFYASPIVIRGLEDNTDYDIRITKTCCDGVVSDPLEVTVNSNV